MVFRAPKRRFWIFIVVLSVCSQVASHSAMANDPATRPVAKPDAGLVRDVGVVAYDAIQKISAADSRTEKSHQLLNLATAQVGVGDMAGARRTLAEAWSAAEPRYQIPDLVELSVRAGDAQRALTIIQTLPEDNQLRTLEKFAVTQVKSGDIAGADKVIAIIDALQARSPREPAPTTQNTDTPNFQTIYSRTLSGIGSAFAVAGDIRRASALLVKVTHKGARASLLAAIAKAQYRAGDHAGAKETLRQLQQDVNAYYDKEPGSAAAVMSRALAFAGETESALAVIAALPLKSSRDSLYAQLAEVLARDEDIVQARTIADATGNADSLILIGQILQRSGRVEEARKTLAAAREALGKSSLAPIDRLLRVGRIVDSLIACGAFAEAVAASQELDELNRPPSILKAIKEEIRRGDRQALEATVPVALEIARAARPLTFQYLADLAATLARAGFTDEAKAALSLAENSVARLSGWQRVDGLNALRRVQTTLGDKEGAAQTERAIEESRVKFLDELAQLRAQGQGAVGDAAKAIELILQAEAADDPTTQAELIQKVALLARTSGLDVVQLMAIAARYDPQSHKLHAIEAAIAEGDFASAMTAISALGGRQKDGRLLQLARAQISAGQFKPAFDTASAIRDPSNRAAALIGIIRAAGPSMP